MEENKKTIKIKFITLILISFFVIVIAMFFAFYSNNFKDNTAVTNNKIENKAIENTVIEDDVEIENLAVNNEVEDIRIEEDSQDVAEEIKEVPKYDYNTLIDTIYAQNYFENAIEEFTSIEKASQEYLSAVAMNSLCYNVKNEDLYNLKYEDFNNELVGIFGEKADRLLKKEYISKEKYDYDPNTETYSINAGCLAENDIKSHIISNIEEIGRDYKVTTYEYIWKAVDSNGLMTAWDAKNIDIYSLDGDRLVRFDIKEETEVDGEYEYITSKLYDSENNFVEDEHQYLKEHLNILKDKREIYIKYDETNDRYIIDSNKIIK